MFRYVVKRLLIFIPTLIAISLIAFGLSKVTPGDPVLRFVEDPGNMDVGIGGVQNFEREYRRAASMLGLDKAAFYFTFTSAAYPDTLYRILQRDKRQTAEKLIACYGNWPEIDQYFQAVRQFESDLLGLPDTLIPPHRRNRMAGSLKQLYYHHHPDRILFELQQIDTLIQAAPFTAPLANAAARLQTAYRQMSHRPTRYKLYIPAFYWYGADNQYHHWFTNFLTGNFGQSYQDNRPVAAKMYDAAFWTILINVISIFIAYLLAIPTGVLAAVKRGQWFDRLSTLLLFMLFSLPSFWVATMLVVFFTTPEYGWWADIFPSIGLGNCDGLSDWSCIWERAGHLILPVFCITYTALAFISRQMRGAMLNVIGQDFVRNARAKGVAEQQIIWKHGFRNSLFPLITLFALVFPAAISGSVVIEVIFNIPGMGRLAFDAMFARDWPVVFTIMLLTAILTMLGNLAADLLYALADPRVAYTKAK